MRIRIALIYQQKILRKAQEAGVKIMINTDAHKKETLDHMKIGVSTAKKGWLKKSYGP